MLNAAISVVPAARKRLLIKAIVEKFCTAFARGGVVISVSGSGKKVMRLEPSALTSLGINLDSEAKPPDIVIHHAKRNLLFLIQAVISAGPVDGKRRKELKELFAGCEAGLVFVTAFETRRAMQSFLSHIAWESEVWIAEDPDHMIHFNGERFLGPYPDNMPK